MWKQVHNYEGVYEMNNDGIIRRVQTKRVISISYCLIYPSVHLCKNGIRKREPMHRLVGFTFWLNDFKPGLVINHKDGNPLNFHPTNIEWVTQSQNIRHSYDVLKRRNSKARYVLNINNGIFYDTIEEAAKTTNYSYQSIRFKLSGRWPNNTPLIII